MIESYGTSTSLRHFLLHQLLTTWENQPEHTIRRNGPGATVEKETTAHQLHLRHMYTSKRLLSFKDWNLINYWIFSEWRNHQFMKVLFFCLHELRIKKTIHPPKAVNAAQYIQTGEQMDSESTPIRIYWAQIQCFWRTCSWDITENKGRNFG